MRQAERVSPREGIEEVGILRHVALEARDGQRAVAQPLHEAMGEDLARPIAVGFPERRSERHRRLLAAHWPSACSRSSMMSCTSSRPTEIRTVPSLMPSLARSSAPMRMCVVVAGWVTMLLESPRLLAMSTIPSLFSAAKHAALPPFTSKVTTPPKADICLAANACCG